MSRRHLSRYALPGVSTPMGAMFLDASHRPRGLWRSSRRRGNRRPAGASCGRARAGSHLPTRRAVIDAVVNISTKQTIDMSNDDMPRPAAGLAVGGILRRILQEPPRARRRRQAAATRQSPRRVNSLGSGFIIDPSGLVVTNNHVIADADEISVILNDGTKLQGRNCRQDTKSDLALLRCNPTSRSSR